MVRLNVRVSLGLALGLGLGLRLGFEPSSPIVRELVLSLTRLPLPLVRFRHNRYNPYPNPTCSSATRPTQLPKDIFFFFTQVVEQL